MANVNLKWDESGQLTPETDDDVSATYLLSRQVAHEYNHPAVQDLIQSDRAAEQVRQQAAMSEMDEYRKAQSKKQAEGKAAESAFTGTLADSRPMGELQPAHGEPAKPPLQSAHVPFDVKQAASKEIGGVEAPMVDPTQAGAAGAGAAFKLSMSAGKALWPSIGSAIRAGVVNMATDPIYGTGAEVVGAASPELALPFNLAVGLLGGMTIEPAIERGIAKAAAAAGKVLTPEAIADQVQLFKGILASEAGQVDVWHGSPHKFDKMDISKVGTGEGGAAFGYGLYFTGKKDIAEFYAKANVTRTKQARDIVSQGFKVEDDFYKFKPEWTETKPGYGQMKKAYWKNGEKVSVDEFEAAYKSYLQNEMPTVYQAQLFPGKDPSEYTFLDWDKQPDKNSISKISKQAKKENLSNVSNLIESVQSEIDNIKNFGPNRKSKYALPEVLRAGKSTDLSEDDIILNVENDGTAYRALTKKFPELAKDENWAEKVVQDVWGRMGSPKPTISVNEKIYRALSQKLGSDREASLFLKRAGIDGIRYPSGTIVGKPEGAEDAFNYVVFDDKDVRLVARESGGQVDDLTKSAVIEEINAEIGNRSLQDVLKTLKGETGATSMLPGAGQMPPVKGSGVPSPPKGDMAETGPNRPGMVKASQEFLGKTNPDITTDYAGEATGGNLRIWGADLQPKYLSDIESPEDIMRVLTSGQEVFSAQKEAAVRGVQSWGMTEEAASKYSLPDLIGRKAGQAFNAEQIEAGRQMLVTSAASLKGMADVVRSGMATDLQKMDFMRAFNTHYAIQMQMSGAAAEAGRALQIFRKAAMSNELRMSQLKDFIGGISGIKPEEIAERLATLDSPGKVSAFVKQAGKATTVDMWNEAYINGMLWLPATHMANTTSNMLTDVMSIGERYVASAISRSPIGSGQISAVEAQSYAYGMMQASSDALRVFAKTFVTGEPSDSMSKLELSGVGRKSITGENVAANIAAVQARLPVVNKMAPVAFDESSALKRGIDFLGEVVRTPGRALLAEDDMFKLMAYRAELNAQSMRRANTEFSGNIDAAKKFLTDAGVDISAMKDHAIIKQAMGQRMAEIVNNPPDDIIVGAKEHARYLTFTSPIHNKVVSAIRASQNPFLKMIVPFVGTPYNVFRMATEHTPLAGAFLKSMRDDFMAGGAQRDMVLAKQAIGTMIWAAAVGLTMNGTVTGYGPRDPNVRKAWLREGNKPYSFKIGNRNIEYGRLEPFASVFGIAADGAEILGFSEPELAIETDKIFPAFLAATTKNYTSKTFLQGISQGLDAAYEADANKMEKFLQNWGRSVVPFSSAVRGTEQAISPERKDFDTMADAIRAEIPWLSETMPRKRDLWGRPLSKEIEKNESFLQTIYRVTSPLYVSTRTDSPIDRELYNMRRGVPMPRREQGFKSDLGGGMAPIGLDPAQYEKMLVLMNDIPLDSTGMKLKPSLDALIKEDDYKSQKDPDKRIDMITDKIKEARDMAKRRMYDTDAVIRESVDAIAMAQMEAQ